MARSVTFTIDAEVLTEITITENLDGTLSFDVRVLEGGLIGDLRALFFDIDGVTSDDSLSVLGSDDLTDSDFNDEGVDSLGRDANINGQVVNELGDFDVGIEFGTSGIAEDDIQETSFVLAHDSLALSLDMIDLADFGVRYTSVGEEGGARTGSVKAGDQAAGVARNDALLVLENGSGSVDLLANDTSGGSVTVTGISDAAGAFTAAAGGFDRLVVLNGLTLGTLFVGTDGVAAFTADGPDADELAEGELVELAFTYQTETPDGSIATADAVLTVRGVNDAPALSDGALTADEDGAAVTLDLATLGDDIDNDDDGTTLTYVITGAPTEGSAAIAGTVLSFDPGGDFQDLNDGETRDVVITVQATDAHGATATNQITVTVSGSDDAPVITTAPGEELGEVIEAINNSTGSFIYDPGVAEATGTLSATGTGLTWTGSGSGAYGSFSIDAVTGDWTYTLDGRSQILAEGEIATELFTATVTNSQGQSVTQQVAVTITGRNDYPAVVARSKAATEDGAPVVFDLTTSGQDGDGDDDGTTLSYELAGPPFEIGAFGVPVDGIATVTGSQLIFDPGDGFQHLAEGETMSLAIPVRAIDSHGLTAQNNMYVNVTGTNDGPVFDTDARSLGDLDIVWGQNTNMGNFIALNDGNGVFSDGQNLAQQSRWIDVAVEDLDGDGDLDIFGTRSSSGNDVFLNDGSGNFTTNGQINLAVSHNMSNGLGDLDGDGDVDAYIVRQSGVRDAVLMNDGSGQFTITQQSVGAGTYLHVELGDIDGDGDLDAVRSSYLGGVDWALNDGTGTFTDAGGPIGTDRTSAATALADVDGDGDLDIVSAAAYDYTTSSSGTGNRVYLNDGTGSFTDTGQSLGTARSEDVTAGDVDGDGDIDLIFGNSDQENRLYLNDGTGNFADSGQALGAGVTDAVLLADMDDDGDLDLIVGDTDPNSSFGVGAGSNRILFNDGNGVFTDSGQSIQSVATRAIAVGDLDGDGPTAFSGQVTELFDGDPEENALVHSAAGTMSFSDVDLSDTHTANFAHQSAGYLGTFTLGTPTSTTSSTDGTLDWSFSIDDAALDHLDAGQSLQQIYEVTLDDGHGGTAVAEVTVTLNGADDAAPIQAETINTISTGTSGSARLISVATDGTMTLGVTLANNGGYAYGTAMGDIDGDGLDDLLMSGDWSGAAIYYADGAGGWTNSGVNIAGQFQSQVEIADIDNDGDGDFYIQNGLGNSEVWRNDGGTFVNVFTYSNVGEDAPYRSSGDAAFADINGDGFVDMLINELSYTVPIADKLFLNDGAGNFTASTEVLPTMTGYTTARLADVNGDGAVDYVTGTATGIFVALNDGTGSFTSAVGDLGARFDGDIELGDFNGDGHLDALRSVASTGVELWLGDGTDTFAFDSLISVSSATSGPNVSVGDFTGDGIADVVQVQAGEVRTLANDGYGNFTLEDTLAPSGFIFGEDVGFA